MDHLAQASRIQTERFRQMTPGQRWTAARRLYWSMRRLKEAGVRALHPDWCDDRVRAEVKALFLRARD